MSEEKELIRPSPITRQLVQRDGAHAAYGQYPDRLWFFVSSIKRMISDPNITDKPLKEHYKEKFDDQMKLLDLAHTLLTNTKSYYDFLKAKKLLEWDIDSKIFKEFAKNNMDSILFELPVMEMYFILLKSTTLKDMNIPSEAFAEARRVYKSFEIDEKEYRLVDKKLKEEIDDELI